MCIQNTYTLSKTSCEHITKQFIGKVVSSIIPPMSDNNQTYFSPKDKANAFNKAFLKLYDEEKFKELLSLAKSTASEALSDQSSDAFIEHLYQICEEDGLTSEMNLLTEEVMKKKVYYGDHLKYLSHFN